MSEGADLLRPGFLRSDRVGMCPILYGWFVKRLKSVVALCGCDADAFGSHSLRRGGASWALCCGMNGEVIRILGDWNSDAYQAYLQIPLRSKYRFARQFAEHIVQTIPTNE